MKINHNMSAIIANNQLLRTENNLTASLERLSSGLKINRSADDAAGMAISTKMHAQIQGLDQASRNGSDGISVIETIDGALAEVSSMIQRMRELSVQAASDTNTPEDKAAIQKEIASLREEIDRVSQDTEFNTKTLLDGSLDQRVYANDQGITRIAISDAVEVDNYYLNITQSAARANVTGTDISTASVSPEGTVVINGISVDIEAGEDFQSIYTKLRNAGEQAEVDVRFEESGADTGAFSFDSDRYGSAVELEVSCSSALASYLGINTENMAVGQDAGVEQDMTVTENGFSSQTTILTDGTRVKITDRSGFEMSFDVAEGTTGNVMIEVTDLGRMTLQIGANEDQTMNIRVPEISSTSLYIDEVDVTTLTGADRAISSFDEALSKVSEARSRIGAYQNRLDSAIGSLDATEQNMTAALSRIQDVDMAQEMSEYTKYNVLSQAATSVLAQANDLPQQVLQLLR